MRVIGIDPGSRCVGFGVVDSATHTPHGIHVQHGVLRLDTSQPLPKRIAQLLQRLTTVLQTHKPQIAVVEEVFVSKSPRSALLLGQARGAVLTILAAHNIDVIGVRPTCLKQHLTGSGRASKRQMSHMVASLLQLQTPPAADAADALALALYQARMLSSPQYHIATTPLPQRKKTNSRSKRQALEQLARQRGCLS
ncbi:MAG: crossover junction endodeoxyribonuclease RuvC [Myxococcota bacterium]